ncbi:4-galactosyl-N-acetylglucosaminide 3-alpha-L-fucosyltransferase FUT6-like [Mytilus trossulus]|uniref:4-galactosyl-N-acetylglucosaminide 3-alpha-L-fucosyltransferase FUT6-like n=1 Tax=Mytilus trossulus TaxID=6551 RepID=UPI00300530E2
MIWWSKKALVVIIMLCIAYISFSRNMIRLRGTVKTQRRLMSTYLDNKLTNGLQNVTVPIGRMYVKHNCTKREYVFDKTVNMFSNDNTMPTIFMYEKHPWDWFKPFNTSDRCCTSCMFTSNPKFYNMSKVVIFFRRLKRFPPEKLAGQIWIYFTNESPTFRQILPKNIEWTNSMSKFDLIMSYRPESDITLPFGVLTKKENPNKLNYTKIFQAKQKDIAWIVSHCGTNSRREDYVKELQKYINVDIYGECGNLKCHSQHPIKMSNLKACKSYVSQKYKFYLSFENSLCMNYVSEKVYDIFEDDNMMLPVVRGAPNIISVLPEGTFIPTIKFKSPKQLAAFLTKIGSSEQKYTSYLRKKHSYSLTNWESNFKTAICDLCTQIKNEKLANKKINVYDRLKEGKCFEPSDIIHE